MNKSELTDGFYCANRPRNCSSQCDLCKEVDKKWDESQRRSQRSEYVVIADYPESPLKIGDIIDGETWSDNPYSHPRNYPAIFSPCPQLPHSTDKQSIQSWFIISSADGSYTSYWNGLDWDGGYFLAKRYGSRNAAMEGIVKIGLGGLYKIEEIIAIGNNSINKTINHEIPGSRAQTT